MSISQETVGYSNLSFSRFVAHLSVWCVCVCVWNTAYILQSFCIFSAQRQCHSCYTVVSTVLANSEDCYVLSEIMHEPMITLRLASGVTDNRRER